GHSRGRQRATLGARVAATGIQALSGAGEHCLFGEQDRDAIDALKRNLATLGATARADVRAGSVLGLGPARRSFDLLLFDAPYNTGAGSVALDKLNRLGWAGADSWVSIETSEKEAVEVAGFEIDAERKVGKAKLTLLRPA
ncbi:MAG: RsmD family RNA methyltransferase, partial [Sphingopyxis sp.]|nr:RsmD family RNA methyltransferase [Sphingopyxis sp.]